MTGDVVLDTSAAVAHLRGVAAAKARLQAGLQAEATLYLPLTAWGDGGRVRRHADHWLDRQPRRGRSSPAGGA